MEEGGGRREEEGGGRREAASWLMTLARAAPFYLRLCDGTHHRRLRQQRPDCLCYLLFCDHGRRRGGVLLAFTIHDDIKGAENPDVQISLTTTSGSLTLPLALNRALFTFQAGTRDETSTGAPR
jgi:hypothetical protein